MGACGPVQPLDRTQHEMAVGGMGHRLGLDSGIDRDAFELALADSTTCHDNRDRRSEKRFELVAIHALAPVGH